MLVELLKIVIAQASRDGVIGWIRGREERLKAGE